MQRREAIGKGWGDSYGKSLFREPDPEEPRDGDDEADEQAAESGNCNYLQP